MVIINIFCNFFVGLRELWPKGARRVASGRRGSFNRNFFKSILKGCWVMVSCRVFSSTPLLVTLSVSSSVVLLFGSWDES